MIARFRKYERYYHLYQQQNFFNETSLICSWGTFNTRRGRQKTIFCKDLNELDIRIKEVYKRRKARGYEEY